MKLNKYTLLFYVLFIFSSCDENDLGTNIGTEDPLETQANILNGTWDLEPLSDKPSIKDITPVTMDGKEVQVFNDMTLTISEGSVDGGIYSTLNTYDDKVWPSSGSWTFQNKDKNKILRSDDISISIFAEVIHNYAQPKVYTLRTSFTTTIGTKEIKWVFNFNRQCSSPFNEGC